MKPDLRAIPRAGLRAQAGFALVEVVVAIFILGAAAAATMGLLTTGTHTVYRAEARQVAASVAQRELEKLREVAYAELALAALPSTSSDPDDPRSQVSGTQLFVEGEPAADLAYNGGTGPGGTVSGGTIAPGPTAFSSGDVSGHIHRFVVWQDDDSCGDVCTAAFASKRAFVAVTVEETAVSSQPFIQVASDFIDAGSAANSTDGAGGSGQVVTAQQLYLSDTPCSTASTEPEPVTPSDHDSHDTTGGCDGSAPDALLTSAPVDPDPADPLNPVLRDYATDIEPGGAPSASDSGLQLLPPESAGCDYTPDGADPHKRIHRWISRPVPSDFEIVGGATLELWSTAIDGAAVSGSICGYLFRRNVAGDGTITDTLLSDTDNPGNAYFTHAANPWPQEWTGIRIRMRTANDTVPSGDRIGAAISLESAGTPSDSLTFTYDHPNHASRLEVRTTTPLE